MESRRQCTLFTAAMGLVVACAHVQAQGQPSCAIAVASLQPCLTFISGSATAEPSSACCSALANVVKSNAVCLCQLLSGNANTIGIKINGTRALQLPSACRVSTPPPAKCKEDGYAVPAMPSSPLPSSEPNNKSNNDKSNPTPATSSATVAVTSSDRFSLLLFGFFSAAIFFLL